MRGLHQILAQEVVECANEEREDAVFGCHYGTKASHPPIAPAAGEPWVFAPATGGSSSAPAASVLGSRPPDRKRNFLPHSTTLPRSPCPDSHQVVWRGIPWPAFGANAKRRSHPPRGEGRRLARAKKFASAGHCGTRTMPALDMVHYFCHNRTIGSY